MRQTDGTTRDRVLAAVRAAATAVGVADVAAELSVHPNTVRFHFDALEQSGLIEQVAPVVTGRGRPRLLYRPASGADASARHYQLLAGILATVLDSTPQGRKRGLEAGFAWGQDHAQRHPARSSDGVAELVNLLGDAGFAPRRSSPTEVELLNCPFLEAATDHRDLVCGIHTELMRGALAGWQATFDVESLEPFVAPGICRTRLKLAARA